MKYRFAAGAFALAALALTSVAEEGIKSGPQPGQGFSAFHPLNLTGPGAGKKVCQV